MSDTIEAAEIYDPAAGSGSLILHLAHELGQEGGMNRAIVYTQDISKKSTRFLRLNMMLNGKSESLGNIIRGDTLESPAHFNVEHLETPQDIQNYIVWMNAEIDEVTAVRSKIRNKQRNCTDPVQMEELKKKCTACTTVLADLRKKKKTAVNVIEDDPKLRELLESEFEARLENDPYLSEREKRAIVGQISPERKEKDYER